MVQKQTTYSCRECGAVSVKWRGQCPTCGAWESFAEQQQKSSPPLGKTSQRGNKKYQTMPIDLLPLKGDGVVADRNSAGIQELDRVLGGGLVKGAAILIGGDPGIGKSTLLLQSMAEISKTLPVAYISGEESIEQIRLRAKRLGLDETPLQLGVSDDARDIAAIMTGDQPPAVMVIDSIQTLYIADLDAAPGTIQQIRASAQVLIRTAKETNTAIFLVGHVTKDGAIAGPKLLEHMVDAVLYFEAETGSHYRLLRCHKNRFGSADEIGVFDMTEKGLLEVTNPSHLFFNDKSNGQIGAVVFGGMEGTRPLLLEIQTLIAPSSLAYPRRTTVGFDVNRLAVILAILETRGGLRLSNRDVFLNLAGGMTTREPSADLAIATALSSAFLNKKLPDGLMVFGELGLSGDVRPAQKPAIRIREAIKMGFQHIWLADDKNYFEKLQKELGREANHCHFTKIKKIDDLIKMI